MSPENLIAVSLHFDMPIERAIVFAHEVSFYYLNEHIHVDAHLHTQKE